MDISYVKKLIKLLDESGVDEIEIEEEGKKVRVSKAHHSPVPFPTFIPQFMPQLQSTPQVSLPVPREDGQPSTGPDPFPENPKRKNSTKSVHQLWVLSIALPLQMPIRMCRSVQQFNKERFSV